MVRDGDLKVTDPLSSLVQQMLPNAQPSGVKLGMAYAIVETLPTGGTLVSVQNPSDSDSLVAAVVSITTAATSTGQTLNVGVAKSTTDVGDTLLDGLTLDATGQFSSFSDADTGTNGIPFNLVKAKGSTGDDYVAIKATTGTSALVGQVILIVIPINEAT